jgi:hypothetical protein
MHGRFARASTQLLILICFAYASHTKIVCADHDPISEKKEVFRIFMEATGAEKQYLQAMDIMTNQLKRGLVLELKRATENLENAGPEKRAKATQLVNDALDRYLTRFKAELFKEMGFPELVDRIYYPVYEKHFSITEFKSIIAFYESPVGKKFVQLAPNLMQESVAIFNKLYGLRVQELSMRIAEEELSRIKHKLENLSDPKN